MDASHLWAAGTRNGVADFRFESNLEKTDGCHENAFKICIRVPLAGWSTGVVTFLESCSGIPQTTTPALTGCNWLPHKCRILSRLLRIQRRASTRASADLRSWRLHVRAIAGPSNTAAPISHFDLLLSFIRAIASRWIVRTSWQRYRQLLRVLHEIQQ